MLVPVGALAGFADGAGEEPGGEGDAQEDEHGLGDVPDRDVRGPRCRGRASRAARSR